MTLTELETYTRDVLSACRLFGITDLTSVGRTYNLQRGTYIAYAQVKWDVLMSSFEGADVTTYKTATGEHAEVTVGDIHWAACRLLPVKEPDDFELVLTDLED